MHRLILGLAPGQVGDHRNGNGLDNRRENLRMATYSQNNQNARPSSKKASPFKGVSIRCNRFGGRYKARPWAAEIHVDGRKIGLGSFPDEVSAAKAYDVAAREHFGEFAKLNFPT